MHTFFRAVIGFVVFFLIIGCSSLKTNSPINADLPPGSYSPVSEPDDFLRYLSIDRFTSDISFRKTISAEGIDDQESTLVDSIAATSWECGSDPYVNYNYILVCDTKTKWNSTWANQVRCQIYTTSTYPDFSAGNIYDESDTPATSYTIRDPDACEIAEVDDKLYVFVHGSNDADKGIFGWYWTINTDPAAGGALSTCYKLSAYYGPKTYDYNVTGLAYYPTNADGSEFHLFVCNATDGVVEVFNQSGSQVGSDLTFDSGDIPVDVCVLDFGSSNRVAYVAVKYSSGDGSDYIKCFRWHSGNANYTTTTAVADDDESPYDDTFDAIIALDCRKYNDHDSSGDDGSVAVLMKDVDDMTGYRIRQINFGETPNDYYKFQDEIDDDDFETARYINGIINHAESFAVTRMFNQEYAEDQCFVEGNFYIIGDRDPDMTYANEDPDDRLDGQNVKVFSNDPTLPYECTP